MNWKYYDSKINKKTTGRCDVSPLFSDPSVFLHLINDLVKPFRNVHFNKIIAIDSLGFVLGGALALYLKKPLVLVRKSGKLPYKPSDLLKVNFTDYTKNKKSFEMKKGSIHRKDDVLIVDEWIETGSQAKAVIELVEKQGGTVAGIACINADKNSNTEILFRKYNCKPIHVSR